MTKQRLQKYLSGAGVCSRRKAEEYIEKGYIYVNGKKAQIGQSVDEDDTVTWGDEVIQDRQSKVYYKMYKPRGIETTCAQQGGKSIVDIIDINERVFPVGRLDKDSEGLILLTNDGRIAHRLMHPSFDHEKEYFVDVYGPISDKELLLLTKPMMILGKKTKKTKVKRVASGSFLITLTEGRNRQIRRMVEKVGKQVRKLRRIRVQNVELANMQVGEYKMLTKKEEKQLLDSIGLEKVVKS